MTDANMEDIITEGPDVPKANHEETARPSPATNEHIRIYLHEHRRSIWAIIKSLNKEIKVMAKELLSQAVDAKIRKVQLYRQLDTDIANKMNYLRRRPKLAKNAAFCQVRLLPHCDINLREKLRPHFPGDHIEHREEGS